MHIVCSVCGTRYPLDTYRWVCGNVLHHPQELALSLSKGQVCGGLLEMGGVARFDPSLIEAANTTLWRYRPFLPLPDRAEPVSMGEGFTPLVETRLDGITFFSKLDFLNPTSSFKDRGTTVLVSAIKSFGVSRALDDSSGNAAASLSAYAARAGIAAEIFTPAHASPAKLVQIQVYGARLNRIEGPRENAARAAQERAACGDAYYASHYYSPFVMAGMKTTAWEIWEQLGHRAPAVVIAPVGQGSNLLGIAHGFQDLYSARLIEKMPRLYAAQAANIAPIPLAIERALDETPDIESKRTIAEGIAITNPVHGKELLRSLRESKGGAIAASEEEIIQARNDLARVGLYVEPTSATAIAALRKLHGRIEPKDTVVVTLTGSGLKTPS
jgi:threonine synthase